MRVTLREGIRRVLFEEMQKNQEMLMMGEAFYYTGSLFSKVIPPKFHLTYGKERILECPVAENGIIGIAFGAALAGMTVVPEIWAADFLLCVGNEIVNDIPKWRYQHRYREPIHMVIRAPMGLFSAGGGGPEHSQCTEAWLHNSPGLTIVAPSTVRDAMGLLRASLKCGDPVIFLEHRQVYDVEEEVEDTYFETELGKGRIVREGKDLTIVAWGMMALRAARAADMLETEGIQAEVIDPRTIKPMDYQMILESVKKTGRLVVAEESPRTGSIAGEIMTRVAEGGAGTRMARLTMPDLPYHYIPEYEASTVPSEKEIAAKARELLGMA